MISAPSPHWTKHFVKLAAATIFVAAVLSISAAPALARAAAPTPCWQQVMNQWYQGEIKSIFPLDCYHEAIKHLPTDIQVYSSARDDINKALQAAIAYDNAKAAAAKPQTTTSSVSTPTTTTKTLAVPVIHTHGPGSAPPASATPILNSASPGGATSFPLPLLILGGLAIVLVAAGGVGLLIRRRQSGPGPA
ncbi:MAG TPA: hypothetical protein VG652_12760 [Gaiellaceae bacterium]|nr:hypothetical protein [Gaiellaceae bacterium]